MSEAEKRRDWRAWEAKRDEGALRRYVWAICREAPPAPADTSVLGSRYVRWLDADYRETSSAEGLPPEGDHHGIRRTHLYEKPPRTVTAPVRRLTVHGPWLPTKFWQVEWTPDPRRLYSRGEASLVHGAFTIPAPARKVGKRWSNREVEAASQQAVNRQLARLLSFENDYRMGRPSKGYQA